MHYGVAEDVDATPPGTSGELGVLAGCEVDVSFAVEFDEFFQDDGAGGHVDAEGEGFGGEDDFEEAVDEEFFDDVAEGGEHAGVVGGEAAGEGGAPVAVAEDFEVFFGDGGDVGVDDVSGVVRLMRERRHWARALSHPMREKMKVMAGSMLLAARMVVTSGRPRGR